MSYSLLRALIRFFTLSILVPPMSSECRLINRDCVSVKWYIRVMNVSRIYFSSSRVLFKNIVILSQVYYIVCYRSRLTRCKSFTSPNCNLYIQRMGFTFAHLYSTLDVCSLVPRVDLSAVSASTLSFHESLIQCAIIK